MEGAWNCQTALEEGGCGTAEAGRRCLSSRPPGWSWKASWELLLWWNLNEILCLEVKALQRCVCSLLLNRPSKAGSGSNCIHAFGLNNLWIPEACRSTWGQTEVSSISDWLFHLFIQLQIYVALMYSGSSGSPSPYPPESLKKVPLLKD